MKVGFVFPGQGSQIVGMGKALVAQHDAAREVFREADEAVGFSLSKLCFDGPEVELQLTANSQPAILTASVAVLRVLQEHTSLVPAVVAGHSLGEYTALVCAGVLELRDAVRVVRRRGELMQAAVPEGQGAMAAIGANAEAADALCRDAAKGDVLTPANYNSPRQTVIAGHTAAVERAIALAEERGFAAKMLKVSAPFHCELMRPAADKLGPVLSDLRFKDAAVPVINNVDAVQRTVGSELRARLIDQVVGAVRWEACVRAMAASQVTHLLEIGPGKALTGMTPRIEPSLKALACSSIEDINAAMKAWELSATGPRASKKEWQAMSQEEKDAEIEKLLRFDAIIERFHAKPHEIYRWMSVDKMPAWLVDGELRFHPLELDEWLSQVGDVERLREKERKEKEAFELQARQPKA